MQFAASHHTTKFRPVPVGAGIGVPTYKIGKVQYGFHGTVGPHVVRNAEDVGTCCQMWSLTAGHVVKEFPHSDNPLPGTRAVYQPWGTLSAEARIGYIAHTFKLYPCSTVTDPFCWRQSTRRNPVFVNRTTIRPDIAAIDYIPMGDFQSVLNTPSGKNPTRRLQQSATRAIDGPAGKIITAKKGYKHQLWGARNPGGALGTVRQINELTNITMGRGNYTTYRICCLNRLEVPGSPGDSGALVAYASSRSYRRYIAGVMTAVDTNRNNKPSIWYIPANDIKTAFANAKKSFHHFWGTRRGYWTSGRIGAESYGLGGAGGRVSSGEECSDDASATPDRSDLGTSPILSVHFYKNRAGT